METNDDKFKMQRQGLQWLYDMELVDDPQLVNNLKLNIFSRSNAIREVEILSLHEYGRKDMLIWLELSWFGRTFFEKHICNEVQDIVSQLLPEFKLRVTSDIKIFEMAKDNIRKFLERGGKNEVSNNNGTTSDPGNGPSEDSKLREASDLLSDQKESSDSKDELRDEAVKSDISSGEEA